MKIDIFLFGLGFVVFVLGVYAGSHLNNSPFKFCDHGSNQVQLCFKNQTQLELWEMGDEKITYQK